MKKIVLTVLSVLFGLMMVNSGLNKFFNYMPAPEGLSEGAMNLMGAFINSGWIFPLVAVVEIVGGVLFALPKTRALGAIVILPVMVGIVLFHAVQEPANMAIVLVMLAINVWAIIENVPRYMPMLKG